MPKRQGRLLDRGWRQCGDTRRRTVGYGTSAVAELILGGDVSRATRRSVRRRCSLLATTTSHPRNIFDSMMIRTIVMGMSSKREMKNGEAGKQANPPGEHRHQHQAKGAQRATGTTVSSAHAGGAAQHAMGLSPGPACCGFEQADHIDQLGVGMPSDCHLSRRIRLIWLSTSYCIRNKLFRAIETWNKLFPARHPRLLLELTHLSAQFPQRLQQPAPDPFSRQLILFTELPTCSRRLSA